MLNTRHITNQHTPTCTPHRFSLGLLWIVVRCPSVCLFLAFFLRISPLHWRSSASLPRLLSPPLCPTDPQEDEARWDLESEERLGRAEIAGALDGLLERQHRRAMGLPDRPRPCPAAAAADSDDDAPVRAVGREHSLCFPGFLFFCSVFLVVFVFVLPPFSRVAFSERPRGGTLALAHLGRPGFKYTNIIRSGKCLSGFLGATGQRGC